MQTSRPRIGALAALLVFVTAACWLVLGPELEDVAPRGPTATAAAAPGKAEQAPPIAHAGDPKREAAPERAEGAARAPGRQTSDGGPLAAGSIADADGEWVPIERLAPPYPWSPPPQSEVEEAYGRAQITLDMLGQSLAVGLRFLTEHELPPLVVDPELRPAVDAATVQLRLRGIAGTAALRILCAAVDEECYVEWSPGPRLRRGRPEGQAPAPERSIEWALGGQPGNNRWREDLLARVEAAPPVSLELDDVPLSEALARLGEQADLEVACQLFAGETRVTPRVRELPLRVALERLLTPLNLTWRPTEPGTLRVIPRRPEEEAPPQTAPGPALRDRELELDLRGVAVHELAWHLAARGVPVFADRAAWSSTATFSLRTAGPTRLGELVEQLAATTGLEVWIDWNPRGPDQPDAPEAVLVRGALGSVREALSEPPPPLPGPAREQLARAASALRLALRQLRPVREAGQPAPELLRERERAALDRLRALRELHSRARAALAAPAERDRLERRIAHLRARQARALDEDESWLARSHLKEADQALQALAEALADQAALAAGQPLP